MYTELISKRANSTHIDASRRGEEFKSIKLGTGAGAGEGKITCKLLVIPVPLPSATVFIFRESLRCFVVSDLGRSSEILNVGTRKLMAAPGLNYGGGGKRRAKESFFLGGGKVF